MICWGVRLSVELCLETNTLCRFWIRVVVAVVAVIASEWLLLLSLQYAKDDDDG